MDDFGTGSVSPPNARRASAANARAQGASKDGNKASRPPSPPQISKTDQMIFNEFPELALPEIDQAILATILKKLGVDVFDSELAGEQSGVKFDQQKLQSITDNNIKKLGSIHKKKKKKSVWAKVGRILGWVAAGLGIVLGVVLAIVSFGTGAVLAGVLITMSIALAVTLIALEETGVMDKLADQLAKPMTSMFEEFGMSKDKAKRAGRIAAQVLIAVIVIAVQLTLAIASGGANSFEFANELAQKVAAFSIKAVAISMAVVSAASAGTQVASSVYNYQMMQDQADMIENDGFLAKLHAMIESQQNMIREIIDVLLGTQTKMSKLIKDENESRGILADIDAQPSAV